MAIKKFSSREAIQFSWNTVKADLGFFIGFLLLGTIVQYVPVWLSEALKKNSSVLSVIVGILGRVVQMIVSMGYIKMALKFHDGAKGEWSDLYTSYPLTWKYILSSICYGLIVFVGLLLLIVPGIIWAIRYQFFSYLLVDQNLGPIEAIKKSGELTKGGAWDLFLFGLAATGIMLLGALCLLVGLFVAMPVVLMAGTFVYRKLLSQSGLLTSASL